MLVDEAGISCADIAVMSGHLDVYGWLEESCADIAAQNGHLDVHGWLEDV